MYSSEYFRQDKSGSRVKLPFKWMPLESMQEGLFSQKSDVVSCPHIPSQHETHNNTVALVKDEVLQTFISA